MYADGVGLQADFAAIFILDDAFTHRAQHALGDPFGVVQHRTRPRARDQRAFSGIGAVGERFGDAGKPGFVCPVEQRRVGQHTSFSAGSMRNSA